MSWECPDPRFGVVVDGEERHPIRPGLPLVPAGWRIATALTGRGDQGQKP